MTNLELNLEKYRLIIFDDFGTLTNTPFRDHQELHMLPGRVEILSRLREVRQASGVELHYAVYALKGGVAFGKQSEDEAKAEVVWTARQIGTEFYAVCFGHPSPASGFEEYSLSKHMDRRKPSPAMIQELMIRAGATSQQTLVIDDRDDGQEAAKLAGCDFLWPRLFFTRLQIALAALAPQASQKAAPFDPFLDVEVE